jgi:hypothetical protein
MARCTVLQYNMFRAKTKEQRQVKNQESRTKSQDDLQQKKIIYLDFTNYSKYPHRGSGC